jgi:hypothetical protein
MKLLLDTNVMMQPNYQKLIMPLNKEPKFSVLGNSVSLNELLFISPESDLTRFEHGESVQNFLDVVDGRWFRQINTITGMELAGSKYKYWFESCADQKHIRNNIQKVAQNPDIRHLGLSKPEVAASVTQSSIFKTMQVKFFRQPFSNKEGTFDLRAALLRDKITDFQEFWDSDNSMSLRQSWERGIFNGSWIDFPRNKLPSFSDFKIHRDRYSYFNLLIKGFVFICFDSAVGENGQRRALDKGCQMDMFQVVMMRDADILITEEKGFMRRCFNALWGNDPSKHIFNINEFTMFA